jgi:hypothetical protein
MRRENRDDIAVCATQLLQTRYGLTTRLRKHGREPGGQAQTPGRGLGRIELHGLEISITGVQQPAVARFDGHARVTARVAEQGHQQHILDTSQRARALQSEPSFALRCIGLKVGHVAPKLGIIAWIGPNDVDLRVLKSVEVYRRLGEILEPARVVDVEMREDDVAYILGRKPQPPEFV